MKIEMWKITDIKPYDRNPRKNDNAVEAVANSIKEFGWKQPIVIDSDGVIIAGHTRYKAARKLHITEIPVIVADDLTEEQVRAYRLADNKSGEQAEWDGALLQIELDNIFDFDMSQFGFDAEILSGAENKIEALDLDESRSTHDESQQIMHCPKCGFIFEVAR